MCILEIIPDRKKKKVLKSVIELKEQNEELVEPEHVYFYLHSC